MAFLCLIMMRILKQDFIQLDSIPLDPEDPSSSPLADEETGWKLLHGDVFRPPFNPELFSAIIGVGHQLMSTAILVLTLAVTNIISTTYRGQMLSTSIVVYNLLGVIGGCSGGILYAILTQGMNPRWMVQYGYTLLVFQLPTGMVFAWVNSLAMGKGTTAALPFTTILTLVTMILLIGLPSTLFGNIVGRYLAKKVGWDTGFYPTRTTKIPRQIPMIPWWKGPLLQIFVGGCLPFSAIYIELHYIFSSLWGHAMYTLFGILLMSLILLILVVSSMSIVLLYFQLMNEDHAWQWRCVSMTSSCGIFLFFYSIIYFYYRSDMVGVLQGSFFFGYMAVISYAIGLGLGSVGYVAGLGFVRYIYNRVKVE